MTTENGCMTSLLAASYTLAWVGAGANPSDTLPAHGPQPKQPAVASTCTVRSAFSHIAWESPRKTSPACRSFYESSCHLSSTTPPRYLAVSKVLLHKKRKAAWPPLDGWVQVKPSLPAVPFSPEPSLHCGTLKGAQLGRWSLWKEDSDGKRHGRCVCGSWSV